MVMDADVAEVQSTAAGRPGAHVDRVLHDKDVVELGGSKLTAYLTPGHTKGCTTWTMQVDEGGKKLNAVIIGSPNVNPGYVLVGNKNYPGIADDYVKTFTVLNSVQPGGIHPMLTQTTMGNGPLTGEEVQISVNLSSTLDLPPDHYFFVPQVEVNNGGTFYWLSASRPISGAGTTPFPPGFTDLQAWTRDQFLDPDWLRVGTDIVGGGANAPTYNTAFALDGTVVPEPASIAAVAAGLALIGLRKRRTAVR